MKNSKVIILDSCPNSHRNIEQIFIQLKSSRDFISFYSETEALNLFTFFHCLGKQDIIFVDLNLSDRIIKILNNKNTVSTETPQIYITSSEVNYSKLFPCSKNKLVLDFIPKPIMKYDIQALVA